MRLDKVTVRFGEQIVLEDFSLTLPAQGWFALMGPSGIGKTTLLRVMMGLEKAQSGQVDRQGQTCATLFQEDRLLPWLTARGNVEAVLDKGEKDKAAALLTEMGLEPQAFDKYPHELSGGMRRRVALARLVGYGGDVWLMDEAFKGLDVDSKHRVMDALRGYGEKKLILMVTHDEEDARYLDAHILQVSGPPLRVD